MDDDPFDAPGCTELEDRDGVVQSSNLAPSD